MRVCLPVTPHHRLWKGYWNSTKWGIFPSQISFEGDTAEINKYSAVQEERKSIFVFSFPNIYIFLSSNLFVFQLFRLLPVMKRSKQSLTKTLRCSRKLQKKPVTVPKVNNELGCSKHFLCHRNIFFHSLTILLPGRFMSDLRTVPVRYVSLGHLKFKCFRTLNEKGYVD